MPSYSDETPQLPRECPDCRETGTIPVRLIGGKRRRCAEHQAQYRRYEKRESARVKTAQVASRQPPPRDQYRPEKLLANWSRAIEVDPLWAQDVQERLERAQISRASASRALANPVSQSAMRRALRELLLSLDEVTRVVADIPSHVRSPGH